MLAALKGLYFYKINCDNFSAIKKCLCGNKIICIIIREYSDSKNYVSIFIESHNSSLKNAGILILLIIDFQHSFFKRSNYEY
jgi:hypothetical protein